MNMKNELVLIVNASWTQLDGLFKLRDEAKGTLQELLNRTQISHGDVLHVTTQFFLKSPDFSQASHHHHYISSSSTERKENEGIEEDRNVLSIEIKFSSMGSQRKNLLLHSFQQIRTRLEPKYANKGLVVNEYILLTEILSFFLAQRNDLGLHLGALARTDTDEKIVVPCEICDDPSFIKLDFCGVNVCAKCKMYFYDLAVSRKNLTLRCRNPNAIIEEDFGEKAFCANEFGNLDVNCSRCLFERGKLLGLLEGYFHTESQQCVHPVGCAVCSKSEAFYHILFGMALCTDCTEFLDFSLSKKRFLLYSCKKNGNCPLAHPGAGKKASQGHCPSCLMDRIKDLGILEFFEEKSQDLIFQVPVSKEKAVEVFQRRSKLLYPDENQCPICADAPLPEPFLGLKCCEKCKAFVTWCMTREQIVNSLSCSKGQNGQLCCVEKELFSRCKYCWLRRVEIEGFVERWLMSEGYSEVWSSSSPSNEVGTLMRLCDIKQE